EVNGHDRGSRPEIGVTDQCVELPAGFDDASMDGAETFLLLRGVTRPVAQGALLTLSRSFVLPDEAGPE
ncbi:MAG TPA: hypothetical protein VG408_01900, partial [Actinomycetota bacterium]|nr:hypothetical protein [Actinomycetota bacterium]